MKKVLLLMVLLASFLSASAQDVIVKKDGSTILSKVIEIGTTEVKYKKWNNLNGPNYTISKSDLQAINFENGENETFKDEVVAQPQQFSYNDYSSQIVESMNSSNRYQKEKLLSSAKAWRRASFWACLVPFAGGIVAGVLLDDKIGKSDVGLFDCGTYWLCCGIGLGVGVAGTLICQSVARNKEKLASTITVSHIIQKGFTISNSRLSAGIDLMNDQYTKDKALGLGLSYNF